MENSTQSKKQVAAAILFMIIAVLHAAQVFLSSSGVASAATLGASLLFGVVPYGIIAVSLLQNKGRFPTAVVGFLLLAANMLWSLANWIVILVRHYTGFNVLALASGPLPVIVLSLLNLASYVLIVILYFFAAYGWTAQREAARKFILPIFLCRLLIVIITGIQAVIPVAAAVMAGGDMPSGTERTVPTALLAVAIAVLMMIGMRKAARAAAK